MTIHRVTYDEAFVLAKRFDATFPEYTRRAAWRLHEDRLRERDATVMRVRERYTSGLDNASLTEELNGTDEHLERG